MLLYIIISIAPLNTTYYITFAFLSVDIVNNYYQILDIIKKLYEFLDILDSKVIITNTNSSIICAISEEFLLAFYLLCFEHINKNIITNCKKLFKNKKL